MFLMCCFDFNAFSSFLLIGHVHEGFELIGVLQFHTNVLCSASSEGKRRKKEVNCETELRGDTKIETESETQLKL